MEDALPEITHSLVDDPRRSRLAVRWFVGVPFGCAVLDSITSAGFETVKFALNEAVVIFLSLPGFPLVIIWRWLSGAREEMVLYPAGCRAVAMGCVYWALAIYAFARGMKRLSAGLLLYFAANVALVIALAILDDSP